MQVIIVIAFAIDLQNSTLPDPRQFDFSEFFIFYLKNRAALTLSALQRPSQFDETTLTIRQRLALLYREIFLPFRVCIFFSIAGHFTDSMMGYS